jgi:hypothetical protein
VQKKPLLFKNENYSSGFDKRTGWRNQLLPRLNFDARNGQPPCINHALQQAGVNGHTISLRRRRSSTSSENSAGGVQIFFQNQEVFFSFSSSLSD